MPDLSRSQLFVYGAIAVAVVLVGARWLRSDQATGSGGGVTSAPDAGATGDDPGSFSIEQGGDGVVIHVAGAVREPGVYRLPQGSRVADAVERAGGASAAAAADGINLAAVLADGQQVVVPTQMPGVSGISATAPEGPISLGTATIEELETIEGIGPVTAGEIIEFRDEHGGVGSVEDLDQISGIGPATMGALRDGLQP